MPLVIGVTGHRNLDPKDYPLYRTYELAPRVANFGALEDQQLAGAFMKVGNIPIIWAVIAVMFVRWWKQERAREVIEAKERPPAGPGGRGDRVAGGFRG